MSTLFNKKILLQDADIIRYEDKEAHNTAERVGRMFVDIINAIDLSLGGTSSLTLTEVGNYLTNNHYLTQSVGDGLYQPKGNYLTQHQSLSNYYTKPEIDTKITALNTAIGTKLDKSVFDDLFEKVQVNGQWVIRAKYGFYSNQFISALGLVQGDLGGGAGTGGSLFGLMRSWPSVDPGPSTQEALGANLGWELRGRIAALETAGYATQNWVLNKNYLTAHQDISHLLSKTEAASLYQPKGNYLTAHQSLSHLLSKTEAASLYQPKGNYLTGITKAMVEAVLTGTITTHNHDSRYYTEAEIDTKITALNTAIGTKLDKSVFDDLFEKVQVNGQWVIRAKYGFYSNQFISALGLVQGDLGGGAGTGGSLFGLMRAWPSVDPGPSTQEALGANLGWELRNRIAALETAGFATQNWVLNKNYLTAHQDITHLLSKTEAASLYQPKGNYLTAHQSLSHLLRIDGSNGTTAGTAALLNKLEAGGDNINDNMTFITSLSTPGANTAFFRRPMSYLWNYIKGKADAVYQPKGNYALASALGNYYTKPEIDTKISAINTAIGTKLDKSVFDDLFEKVQVNGQWVIRAKYGFYSNQFISALGLVQGDLGGGTGTGGSLFGLMREWPTLNPGPSTQEALGANLGWELRNRIAALETAGFATQNWVLNKNYLTAHQDITHLLSKTEAASLYQPKGNYLTAHQSLAHLLRIDGSNGTAAGVSALIGKLSDATADVLDSTKFVTSDNAGDATSKLYYRRPATALWNYIKGKADAVYQPKASALNFTIISGYLAARFNDANMAKKAADDYIEFWQGGAGLFNFRMGNVLAGKVEGSSIVKSGGTSSQFLMADGSVDSNSYVKKSGDTMTGELDIQMNGHKLRLYHDNYTRIQSDVEFVFDKKIWSYGVAPYANNTYSCGDASYRWANVYATTINVTSTALVSNLNADMLDGLHVGNGINRVARFTNFPAYADFGYEGTAAETYFSYLLKKLATDNSGEIMAVGRAHPNSQGVFIMHGYSGRKNGYPQYGSGLYVAIDGRVVPIRVQDGIYTCGNGIFDGNAASASRLQTTGTYTAWGQTFFANGVPQSVSGSLTGVGIVKFSTGDEISFQNRRFCFGTTNQSAAQGVNVGSLLVSNAWADYTKVPVNGAYVKGQLWCGSLRLGDILIEEDKANGGLKISGGVYATKYVSALGLATGNLSGGSSGGGTAYDRLDAWADYTTDKSGYVLSAALGADLNSRVGANATSINSILSRLNSLEGGGTTSVTVTGSGNAITDISKGGTAIIATKGATFLTQHQPLDHINSLDTRNSATTPSTYGASLRVNFKSNATNGLSDGGTYNGELHFKPYGGATDHSAGYPHQLGFTANGNIWHRVGTSATAWGPWQKILTSANYASVLGSVYQAKGDYVTVAGTQTITGIKIFDGGLRVPYSAGTWISMAKRTNQILGSVPTAGSSAHSLFTLLNSTGAAISYGGLGVNIGFYGFYKSRMDSGANSYDWATTWDLDTGRLLHSGDLVSRSFIKNGGTSSQFLMADGSTVSKVSASDISHTGWGGIATDDLRIPTMTFLALWNGAYNSNGASYLQYCYQGRFGDIVTQSLSGLDSRYVNKAGDTMTGELDIQMNGHKLRLYHDNYTRIQSDVEFVFDKKIWSYGVAPYANNTYSCGDASYRWANVYATTINVTSTGLVSNLNADMLDGLHNGEVTAKSLAARRTTFIGATVATAKANLLNTIKGAVFGNVGIIGADCIANWSNDTHTVAASSEYSVLNVTPQHDGVNFGQYLLFHFGSYNPKLVGRSNGAWTAMKTFAFLDDNVASATKLQTARTLWGQSFDGTGNVNGVFRELVDGGLGGGVAHSILNYSTSPYGLLTRIYGDGSVSLQAQRESNNEECFNLILQPLGGRVAIGKTSAAYTLDVTGTGRFTSDLTALTVYSSNWFRSTGNSGWYSQTYGGGIYMTDANWVRVYNDKAFRVQNGYGIGANSFNVGVKIHGTNHTGVEVSAGNYAMGLGCHSNGSWYWWRGTANPDSAGNKSYVMQYDGTVWKFTGQLQCDSLRIKNAVFTFDEVHNGIKLDKGLYSEGYLSALGLSELTNTKFTINAGYEADALTILNGGIYRSEYWGDEWNKGHGALNVAIHGSSASQQTPLLLAVKADTPKTGWDAPGARLFAMELLDNGEQMKFQMGGSTIATLHKTNGLMATTLSVQTIKLNGGGTLTYDSATGDLRINGKKILVATT